MARVTTQAAYAGRDRRKPQRAKSSGAAEGAAGGRPYYDSKVKSMVCKVLPGEFLMNKNKDQKLVTVLGSCVSACIRDPRTGIGGMNHFMLPASKTDMQWGSDALTFRYGNYAMEVLLNSVLSTGCRRSDLEIKLFGGASVFQSSARVGEKNIAFVHRFLQEEKLEITAEDLGGIFPRRIYYDTATGVVNRLLLQRKDDLTTIDREENSYSQRISEEPEETDIELFD